MTARRLVGVLCLSLLVSGAASATPVTIDFEEFPPYTLGGPITSKGFQFVNAGGTVVHLHLGNNDLGWNACCTRPFVTMFMTRDGGAPFSLHGFEVILLFDYPSGGQQPIDTSLTVRGIKTNGQQANLMVSASTTPRTFSVSGFEDLSRVEFVLEGTREPKHYPVAHLDNFIVSLVPEPSRLALGVTVALIAVGRSFSAKPSSTTARSPAV